MKDRVDDHLGQSKKNMGSTVICRLGSWQEIWQIHHLIPELQPLQHLKVLQERCDDRFNLPLIAQRNHQLLGYKLGYALDETIFYSWLGGVHPDHRRIGVALALMKTQERLVREHGFHQIEVKTMARFPGMIRLLNAQGYRFVRKEFKGPGIEAKMLFSKELRG